MSPQGPYPKNLAHGHTIVGCDISACGLVAAFLEEFFHEDHGYNITHMVRALARDRTHLFDGVGMGPRYRDLMHMGVCQVARGHYFDRVVPRN